MERWLTLIGILVCMQHTIHSSVQVTLFPRGPFYTSAPGGNVTFHCLSILSHHQIVDVVWLLNGSQLGNNTHENITDTFSENLGIGTLHFIHINESYNNTKIQCEAVLFNTNISSNVVVLHLLSDFLLPVRSLNATVKNYTISLTWTPPQNVQSNVTYCVDSTFTVSSSLHSICNITETEFNYPLPSRSWCDVYFISVTPVNAFGNGARRTISYSLVQSSPMVRKVIRLDKNTVQLRTLIMSERVCSGEVTFVDDDTGETFRMGGTDLSISENNITFSTEQLRVNRHFSANITASNIAGSNTSHTSISTHDATGVIVVERNGVEVTAHYSEHSSASGALFSFVFITESDDVDFTRSALLPLDRNASQNHTLPFNLHPGHYMIYVYDIEQDGTLYNGVDYPAVTEELFTSGNGQGPPSYVNNCQIGTFPGVIVAECPLPHGTLQVTAQLINVSEVHKLYVNQSMDLHAPVTVQVERNGAYWVTIFSIMEGELDVEYTEQVVVGDVSTTHSIASTTHSIASTTHSIASTTNSIASTTNSTASTTNSTDLPFPLLGLSVAVAAVFAGAAVVAVVAAALVVLVFIIEHRRHRAGQKSSMGRAKHQYNLKNHVTYKSEVYSKKETSDERINDGPLASRNQGAFISTDSPQTINQNYEPQTKEEEKHEMQTEI